MPINARPPITPPTIALVSEVLTQEGVDVDVYLEGPFDEVEVASSKLPEGRVTPVGAAEGPREPEGPIAVPGPVSGLSKIHRYEVAERKTDKGTLTAAAPRLVEVPITLRLTWPLVCV